MPDANGRLVNEESAHQGLAAVEWTAARVGKSLYYRLFSIKRGSRGCDAMLSLA